MAEHAPAAQVASPRAKLQSLEAVTATNEVARADRRSRMHTFVYYI